MPLPTKEEARQLLEQHVNVIKFLAAFDAGGTV